LSDDTRVHQAFLDLIKTCGSDKCGSDTPVRRP
jgi:hypothetical protein